MLESLQHAEKSFVTLTYSDEKVPYSISELATLEPNHLRDWFKRIRKARGSKKLRYFAVGEYGDESDRPHYHAALFGLPSCAGGPVRMFVKEGKVNKECLCESCSIVRQTWGFGHTMVGELTPQSAMYVAGYVVKKMTHHLDPRLNGRHPEFQRSSRLKGGIGAYALEPVVQAVEISKRPVPGGLRHGARVYPLGRYIRKKIVEKLVEKGFSVEDAEGSYNLAANQEAMRIVRKFAWDNEIAVSRVFSEIINPPVSPAPRRGKI